MSQLKHRWKKILIACTTIVIIFFLIAIISFSLIWHGTKLDPEKLNTLNHPATFYDANHEKITTPHTKTYCQLNEINPDCIHAFIAVEDKNFYNHHGLSYPRIAKAFVNNLTAGYAKEGASTITQQLVKNTHLTNEKTWQRKIREAILALKMEQDYTKDQIIELYLNAIYFGNNIYGIANATQFYYHKTPKEISTAEGAGLAAIIKNPTKYNPITNYQNFVTRTHLVLNLMYEQSYLDDATYQAALNDPLTITASNDLWLSTTYQSMALQQASKILNLSESDIINYGYQIETYYDADQQQILYNAMTQEEYQLPGNKFAVLANNNGQVTALWTDNPTLLNARRNFGSATKPLFVYAPALELGIIQPATLIDDSPLIDSNFNPQNADHQNHGLVSARTALSKSYNIPAVKILEATTINKATAIANQMGFDLNDENLSMALGNTNKGVTFMQLLGGYQTIANNGKYTPARLIRSITDRNGNMVYFDLTNKYNYAPQVIAADTAYLLTDMLRTTVQSGTAHKLSYLKGDLAAKTGTTQRGDGNTNTDATIVAYTPEYVLLTWHGNTSMNPVDDLPYGNTGGGKIANAAKQILSTVIEQNTEFIRPYAIQEISLDATDYQNGVLKIANSQTPDDEIVKEIFATRYVPTEISEHYRTVIPTELNGSVNNNTPHIWFETLPYQTYAIYKNDNLQAVVTNHQGIYHFTDTYPDTINNYYVTAQLPNLLPVSSNQIVLYTGSTTPITTKTIVRKQPAWYF